MEGWSLRQSEEEKRKGRAVASSSSPPCREAWAVPCVPFPNAHLAIASQIPTMEDRVTLGDTATKQQPSSVVTVMGRRSF